MQQNLIKRKLEIVSQFVCQNSGNCCRHSGYVYVSQEEIAKMALQKKELMFDFRKKYVTKVDGWDVIASPTFRTGCFLDGANKCMVYSYRPKACRSYPDWPEIWESDLTLKKELDLCPGLKKAVSKL